MLWTITCRRLRRDRRGISNIIVVALSLVIIVAIASNIVLWNYEMNQVDWERLKEGVSIANVESGDSYPWFGTQSEYGVNTGTKTAGNYGDTQIVDGSYETFTEEASTILSNVTLVDAEGFEGVWVPSDWSATGNWMQENDYAYTGDYSADFDGNAENVSGYLTSASMNCSDANAIYVDFWWQDTDLEDDELVLEYYNGSAWNSIQDLNQLEAGNGWHHYTETVTDSQYFVSDFQVRWWANSVFTDRTACVDVVTVTKRINENIYSFDMTGYFTVDLATYPLEHVQTVEIQMRLRTDDSSENWYLKAYNWASSEYSSSGFNSTVGHNPTTGWDYYTVNITDAWQSYVHVNGTVKVKFVDEYSETEQTSVDVDFMGVKVKLDGTRFVFENEGSLTVHLVSLWIINSTEHQRYDISVFVNSAATQSYLRDDISQLTGNYTVKIITERGNTAVYSEN